MRFTLEIVDKAGATQVLPLFSQTFYVNGFGAGIYLVVKPDTQNEIVALDRGYLILGRVVGDPVLVWNELMASSAKINYVPKHPGMASAGGISGPAIWFDLDEVLKKI